MAKREEITQLQAEKFLIDSIDSMRKEHNVSDKIVLTKDQKRILISLLMDRRNMGYLNKAKEFLQISG